MKEKIYNSIGVTAFYLLLILTIIIANYRFKYLNAEVKIESSNNYIVQTN